MKSIMELQLPIYDLSLSASSSISKAMLLFLLLCTFSHINAERDFNFNDSQVPLLEPKDEPHHLQDPYLLELTHCQHADSEIILSLILKKHDWQDLNDNKRTKLQNKLSKFFAIPKEFILMDSITKTEMLVMQKESMRHGSNKSHFKQKHLGRVSFQIGCGSSYFQMGQPIAKQISSQIKDGSLDNITGEKFGWWIIWRKQLKNRSHRNRRQIEGSGEDDYEYDDDEEEQEQAETVTELPTAPTHAHRHHHGDNTDSKPELTSNSFEDNQEPVESKAVSVGATEDDTRAEPEQKSDGGNDEVSKLESVIIKTIENTKSFIDEPVVDVDGHSDGDVEAENENENADNAVLHKVEDVPDTPQIVKDLNAPIVVEEFNNEVQANIENKLELPEVLHSNDEDELIVPTTTQRTTSKLVAGDSETDVFEETAPVQHNFQVTELLQTVATPAPPISSIGISQIDFSIPSTTTISSTTPNNIALTTTTNSNLMASQETSASSASQPQSPYSPYDASSASVSSSSMSSTVVVASATIVPDLQPIASTTISTKQQQHHHTHYNEQILKEMHKLDNDENDDDDEDEEDTDANEDNEIETTIITNFELNTHSYPSITTHATHVHLDEDELTTNPSPILTTITTLNIPTLSVYSESNEKKNDTVLTSIEETLETNPGASSTSTNSISSGTPVSTTPPSPQQPSSSTPLPDAAQSTTYASTDYVEPKIENMPPMIKTRLQKFVVTSGKSFWFTIPEDTFIDNEDNTNLRLELTDKDGHELKQSSWIQFNVDKREIYGLALDDAVSKWQYRLTATDSGNESVTEIVEISVQQHRGVRTVNHEINIAVKINEKGMHNVDWQLKLLEAIARTLGDDTVNSIVVREIRQTIQDPHSATFAYFNETLPTTECPDAELNSLIRRLDASRLTELVEPMLGIKSITGSLIGSCQKIHDLRPKLTTHMTKNWPPMPRNQVDRVNATVGHLLIFKVPSDTFYDPNDSELKLTLKTKENKELNPRHWLQFDTKNQEFYGIPKSGDIGSEEYLLVAEDSAGLTATDALVVVVSHAPKKEFSVYFKAYLAIRHEQFNADLQRKFVERITNLHGDHGPNNVQIRSVTTHHDSDGTIVNFYNSSLYKVHNRCPEREIEATRNVYLKQDYSLRDYVKKALGPELNLTNLSVITLGSCHPQTDVTHREFIPTKTDEPLLKSTFSEEYMMTIILPAIIIITMILVASIIACCLHRRRVKSGKMELGDEEERKSFHTKGIPVIFQDELDEKPEMGNKSPIILENEKPPLLPPSYNTSNMNGDNDVDEYVPPPAVVVGGGREVRGKSPATPSYRKPPPYVSP